MLLRSFVIRLVLNEPTCGASPRARLDDFDFMAARQMSLADVLQVRDAPGSLTSAARRGASVFKCGMAAGSGGGHSPAPSPLSTIRSLNCQATSDLLFEPLRWQNSHTIEVRSGAFVI
jgi:hypothetical protein